jgi:hypothetical protein
MSAPEIELTIAKGKTFEQALFYAEGDGYPLEITGVPSLVPVRITIPSHGLPDDWPITIDCVTNPVELNGYYGVRVIDADTVSLLDEENRFVVGQCWKRIWSGGGVVRYPAMANITGWTARAMFRRRIGDTVPVLTFTTEPGADGLFIVDPLTSSFTLTLSAQVTETLALMTGVWDAEAVDPLGRIYPLVAVSPFSVTNEVTRVE